jgi:hypothetical protein
MLRGLVPGRLPGPRSQGSASRPSDRGGGALVPALRAPVPRCRGTAQRTRDRGRPGDGLPPGAAVHPAAGRRRPIRPPHTWRPVVRRRNLREGQRSLALRLPSGRPTGPGHRAPVTPPGRCSGPPVLRPGAADAALGPVVVPLNPFTGGCTRVTRELAARPLASCGAGYACSVTRTASHVGIFHRRETSAPAQCRPWSTQVTRVRRYRRHRGGRQILDGHARDVAALARRLRSAAPAALPDLTERARNRVR